jgi:hypothetical protein
MAFSLRTSMNNLKAIVLLNERMTLPDIPRIWRSHRMTYKEEVRHQRSSFGCWRSYLFWLMAVIVFVAFLLLLDLVV